MSDISRDPKTPPEGPETPKESPETGKVQSLESLNQRIEKANEILKNLATLPGGIAEVRQATESNNEVLKQIALLLEEGVGKKKRRIFTSSKRRRKTSSEKRKETSSQPQPTSFSTGRSKRRGRRRSPEVIPHEASSLAYDFIPSWGVGLKALDALLLATRGARNIFSSARSGLSKAQQFVSEKIFPIKNPEEDKITQETKGSKQEYTQLSSSYVGTPENLISKKESLDLTQLAEIIKLLQSQGIEEEQINLLTRLLNNIPSTEDAATASSLSSTKGKEEGRKSLLDKDVPQILKDVSKGLEQLTTVLINMDAEAIKKSGESLSALFQTIEEIDPIVFENLKNINNFIFKTALGISAMAGSLFLLSQVPVAEGMGGIAVMSAAAAAVSLMGLPAVAPLIATGSAILPLLGAALLSFALLTSQSLRLMAENEEGVEALQEYFNSFASLSEINWKDLTLAIVSLGLMPPIIASNAFALRLMPEAGTENFSKFISTLVELASIENLGQSLTSAAGGILAVRAAMFGETGILGMVKSVAGSVGAMSETVVDFTRSLMGLGEIDRNPFRYFIELGQAGNIGDNLKGAAEGILAIRKAMFGQTGLLGAAGDIAGEIGKLVGTGVDIFRSLLGLDEVDRNPFKYYIELGKYGPNLAAAGKGIADLGEGFNKLQNLNSRKLEESSRAIQKFMDVIGIDNLIRLGSSFLGAALREESTEIIKEKETIQVHDAIIRKDGSVIQLNPQDNVYATLSDLSPGKTITLGEDKGNAEALITAEMNNRLFSYLENNAGQSSEIKEAIQSLILYLKEKEEKQEKEIKSPVIINQIGYKSDQLLSPLGV